MKRIIVRQSHIEIHNYILGDAPELEKGLSVWNDTYYRFEPRGFIYDENSSILYLPRGIELNSLEKKFNVRVEIDCNYNDFQPASYKLTCEPRDKNQIDSIAFLIGEGDFKYTKFYSQLSLNLGCGVGKTYTAIAASTFLNMRTLVITHENGVKNQWIESYKKFTNINEEFLCNITGSKDIDKLLKSKNIIYKIFFVNHDTIKSWCKKYGWSKLNDVFTRLGIGLKIFDEAHIEFSSVLKIDFYTNVYKTFYLTATFERTGFRENKIFHNCFKNTPRFGVEISQTLRKHTIYLSILFDSKPSIQDEIKIKGRKGFDRNAYIDYQLNNGMIFDVLKFILDKIQTMEGKTAILSSKINSSMVINDFLNKTYTSKKSIPWNSSVSPDVKAKSVESDFISSTPKSLGVAIDIPGLRFLIMTEPFSSTLSCEQIPGRLREYSPFDYTYYIELVDIGFSTVYKMYKRRLKVYKKKFKALNEIEFN